jgi:BioD-like phosphotransacetylase family protein
MLSKEELKDSLSNNLAKVIFKKMDGTMREMNCTLMESYIPQKTTPVVPHVPRVSNDEVLAVWDIDNSGWRSFRLDSVVEIKYIGVDNAASA